MASGIYQIKNQINSKRYIGSSVNLERRWRRHLSKLRREKHSNPHLQRAFDKYGEAAFVFEVLEYAGSEALMLREQHFLDGLNPEYNISPIAGSPMSGLHHTAKTKQRLSEALSGERHPNFGKRFDIETRRKISAALTGRQLSMEHRRKISGERHHSYGKQRSEETRRKISEAHKGMRPSEESRRKNSEAHRGKRASKETRFRMSTAQKMRWSMIHAAKNRKEKLA